MGLVALGDLDSSLGLWYGLNCKFKLWKLSYPFDPENFGPKWYMGWWCFAGLSRVYQGNIKVALGVLWRLVGGSTWDLFWVQWENNMSWSPRTFQFTYSPIQKGSYMIVGTVRSKRNPSMHGKWPNAFSSLSSSIFRGGHILHYWGCYGTLLHCEIFLSGLVTLFVNNT